MTQRFVVTGVATVVDTRTNKRVGQAYDPDRNTVSLVDLLNALDAEICELKSRGHVALHHLRNCDGNPCECGAVVRARADLETLEAESERYREALEKMRELMGPKNRERFVMMGPMAFSSIYNLVENALRKP